MAFSTGNITVQPGDSAFIPVRVSIPVNALGGLNYVLNGTFRPDNKIYQANAYITILRKSNWQANIDKSNIFFNIYRESVDFKIYLTNKGNVHEMIRLKFDIGRLLMSDDIESSDNTVFINLNASRDTVLTDHLRYNKDLKYSQLQRYRNNWKESTVSVDVSTFDVQRNFNIRINKLDSEFENFRLQGASPLNVEYQVYNLLSTSRAKFNARIFGNLLLPQERDLDYLFGVNNIYFSQDYNRQFDFFRQFKVALEYTDARTDILFSDNNHGGNIHYLSGWGFTGRYKIGESNYANLALMQHPFSLNRGLFAGYDTKVGKINLKTGITIEDNPSGKYKAYSILVGPGFSFLKRHYLNIDFLISNARYANFYLMQADTSVVGFSYRLNYRFNSKRFQFRLMNLNTTPNYIKNSGINNIHLESKYLLKENARFDLYYSRNKYAVSRYPYGFYFPANYDLTDFGRLTTVIGRDRVIYQFGPIYSSTIRNYYNPVSDFSSKYTSYNPGLSGSVSFRIKEEKTITPNISVYNIRFKYESEDPIYRPYHYYSLMNYSAGLNYYDDIWKISAIYSSGSTSDLFRSVQVEEEPILTQSIQIRPAFEKSFHEDAIRLSGYANYLYYMPSGRESFTFNLRNDFWLPHGWLVYFSANIYINSRVEEETGRISTKDLNLFAGVRKSFDIQQPRLKYYDITGIFFNDLNGNMIKEDEEPPAANILVNIRRDPNVNEQKTNFAEINLVSSIDGLISYTNLPEGLYNLSFIPLDNLKDLYFVNGIEQVMRVSSDQVYYIPLAESYKIKGKIVIDRDPNSSEGKVSLEGIKVTAVGPHGETFSTLTDAFGQYVLNVPQAYSYTVSIFNVFGEQFYIEMDQFDIQFADFKSINLDFKFIEKRREIRIRDGEEYYEFRMIKKEDEK